MLLHILLQFRSRDILYNIKRNVLAPTELAEILSGARKTKKLFLKIVLAPTTIIAWPIKLSKL